MRRLAVLHTVGMLVERFKGLLAGAVPASVDVVHMLDESLLRDLMREGETPAIVRRVVSLATQAADSGAGLVVFAATAAGIIWCVHRLGRREACAPSSSS